jgi:hypothetical protein
VSRNFAQGAPAGQRPAVTREGEAGELRGGKLLQNMSQPCWRPELGFQLGELQPQAPAAARIPSRRGLAR